MGAAFVTTHWSVVLAASQGASPQADEAMAKLCADYWYPVYAYLRRRGYGLEEAQDLTQEFFARLIERNYLAHLKREGGKFRSFLLTALNHFLANQWDQAQTQKRGGGRKILSLDEVDAEGRYLLEPVDNVTPEILFERRWALAVLDHVLERLRQEYAVSERADLFKQLQGFLSGNRQGPSYAEVAAAHHISEGAVKMAVHRLRKRYGELLREEIAGTVGSQQEVDEEIQYLLTAVSR